MLNKHCLSLSLSLAINSSRNGCFESFCNPREFCNDEWGSRFVSNNHHVPIANSHDRKGQKHREEECRDKIYKLEQMTVQKRQPNLRQRLKATALKKWREWRESVLFMNIVLNLRHQVGAMEQQIHGCWLPKSLWQHSQWFSQEMIMQFVTGSGNWISSRHVWILLWYSIFVLSY